MSDLGKRIIEGLEQAVEYVEGNETGARATSMIVDHASVDVAAIRKSQGLTQHEFAQRFGFSVHTIRGWEQGQRQPEKPTKLLLMMIRDRPEMVEQYLNELSEGG